MQKEKLWGILVHLSMDMWKHLEFLNSPLSAYFEEDVWNEIIDRAADAGMNAIVLDVGNGIRFQSHPEIAKEDAYSIEWAHEQVRKCREKGIALIPKLNFATTHDMWLGDYSRMISSPTYYKVTKELIEEVYEIFEHPAYIHLGMDDEGPFYLQHSQYAVFRRGELYFHDLKYLCGVVSALGATPWIWSSSMQDMPELFREKIDKDELVISPYYYYALRRENWTPISSKQLYIDYYKENFPDLDISYVEEDPYNVRFRLLSLPMMEYGYKYIPCASVDTGCECNTEDIMEYYKRYADDEKVLGYITAPWCPTKHTEKCDSYFEKTFRFFKEAKAKIYG